MRRFVSRASVAAAFQAQRSLSYEPRMKDYTFLLHEVLDYEAHYKKMGVGEDCTKDLLDSMLEECSKISTTTLHPLYQIGDQQGCKLDKKEVITPKGFKEAWQTYVEGGWQGVSAPTEYGGQGLPASVSLPHKEMMATANWAWLMYPGLSAGAITTLAAHGNKEQKELYLRKMIEGAWTGTMCLTEPQCGTDLGQVKTKAEDIGDGKFKITGTKIFISSGDHDFTENIVHIVLARLPDAPAGTKGISLFLVPRHVVKADGSLEKEKNVLCTGLEKKMGIHGNATCTMSFDGSIGYLIGKHHDGMRQMFTFMNTARLGTAVQGVCHAELAFQNALSYAKERRSMRALSGTKDSNKAADLIIHHAGVKEKILFAKAIAEAGRAFVFDLGKLVDVIEANKNPQDVKDADSELGFYTPIAKGFLTELGLEAANHGVQVWGGHGYITGNGMEQIARDARISTLYEGTTGVQALDFIARKLLLAKKNEMRRFQQKCRALISGRMFGSGVIATSSRQLFSALMRLKVVQGVIGVMALKDKEAVGTAANDMLLGVGYLVLGYYWIRMAVEAEKQIAKGKDPTGFYQMKVDMCDFYFQRIFPRHKLHLDVATVKPDVVLKPNNEALDIKS